MKMFNPKPIKDYIEKHNMSNCKFCEYCDITKGCLKRMLENNLNFKFESLLRVALSLDIPLENFFE